MSAGGIGFGPLASAIGEGAADEALEGTLAGSDGAGGSVSFTVARGTTGGITIGGGALGPGSASRFGGGGDATGSLSMTARRISGADARNSARPDVASGSGLRLGSGG